MQEILIFSALPLSAVLSLAIGKKAIQLLHQLKFGQHIREEGPASHHAKSGTPTMGGVIFLLPILVITALFSPPNWHTLVIVLSVALVAGLGFLDDYLIIRFKNNKGISPRQKLAGQMLIGLLLGLYLKTNYFNEVYTEIPFLCYQIQLGWLFVPFAMLVFAGTTNAVNLTDGLDGLATSVSIICLLALLGILLLQGNWQDPMRVTVSVLALATMGGCLGFLWFNSHPAQVFMGDTGSLALGGVFSVLALTSHLELWLVFIGSIFVVETLSVIIQVFYFKKTKKRFFRMSPLHHHFELSGWKETQVVNRFCILSVLCAVCSIIGYYFCHNMT